MQQNIDRSPALTIKSGLVGQQPNLRRPLCRLEASRSASKCVVSSTSIPVSVLESAPATALLS